MQTTKTTAKFFLIIAFLAANALAEDGQMNGGGKSCDPRVQTCFAGGNSQNEPNSTVDAETVSVLDSVIKYLASLLG